MDAPAPAPPADPAGSTPRLLTISEAAALSGFSRKAIARRVDRGSLRSVKDSRGRRVVPQAELVRAGLLTPGGQPGNPGGELVKWQQLYEAERQERQCAQQRAHELELELTAIASAGPIRAIRLRRKLRADLSASK